MKTGRQGKGIIERSVMLAGHQSKDEAATGRAVKGAGKGIECGGIINT